MNGGIKLILLANCTAINKEQFLVKIDSISQDVQQAHCLQNTLIILLSYNSNKKDCNIV